MSADEHITGEVVAAYGRQYLVDTLTAGHLLCVPRGKKSLLACGDRVRVGMTGTGQGVIDETVPRATLYYRAAAHRTKLIAANATQLAVICATNPDFSDELVARALVMAEHQGMKTLLVINKSDLTDRLPQARQRMAPFALAGYRLIEMCAKRDISPIAALLEDELTVLVGQSGMGKSTLLNALVPDAAQATDEISVFLAAGRHTTTHSRLYRTGRTAIIDCPGLQEFGLAGLLRDDIEAAFPEFRSYMGKCRFQNCRHATEPGCAIREASATGLIDPRRLELFQRIVATEFANARTW